MKAIDWSAVGGQKAASASTKELRPLINQEVLLNDGDVVSIPADLKDLWGVNPQLDNASFVVCEKNPGDFFAMYPNSFSRRINVGQIIEGVFKKEDSLNQFQGTWIDEVYMPARRVSKTEGDLMEAIKNTSFTVTVKESKDAVQGWTTNSDGKRVLSNSSKDARQGYKLYILTKK